MDRISIFNRITGERLYQDINYANRKDGVSDSQKPVSEWLNYIEFHLQKAKLHNYNLNKEESLHELRKIAALAIAAMEVHGCPAREIETDNNDDINYDCLCGDCQCWNKQVFKIDVGNIPEGDIQEYINKVAQKFKNLD